MYIVALFGNKRRKRSLFCFVWDESLILLRSRAEPLLFCSSSFLIVTGNDLVWSCINVYSLHMEKFCKRETHQHVCAQLWMHIKSEHVAVKRQRNHQFCFNSRHFNWVTCCPGRQEDVALTANCHVHSGRFSTHSQLCTLKHWIEKCWTIEKTKILFMNIRIGRSHKPIQLCM